MKYCQTCGAELHENAVICTKCGCSVSQTKQDEISQVNQPGKRRENDGLGTAAKVFLVLGCIAEGWLLLPLAWCLPITISIFGKINRGEKIGTGLKVCSLLFVNLIGGILLLCRSDEE